MADLLKYLGLILILILLVPTVVALKGAGIKWADPSAVINEGSTKCIPYGIYNPWDEDISISLSIAGDITQFADSSALEPKFVKAGTFNEYSIWQEICFTPKDVKGCSPGETINFKGEIVASPVIEQETRGSGSVTATAAAAPLEIAVKCGAEVVSRNIILWGIIALAILIVIILIILLLRKKKQQQPL